MPGSRNVTARTLEKLTQEDSPKVGRPSKAERGMYQESGNCPNILSHHNRSHTACTDSGDDLIQPWRWLNTALVFSVLIARNYHWNWPSSPITHPFPTVRSVLPFLENVTGIQKWGSTCHSLRSTGALDKSFYGPVFLSICLFNASPPLC